MDWRDRLFEDLGIIDDGESAVIVVATALEHGGPFDDIFKWCLQLSWEQNPDRLRELIPEEEFGRAFR